MDPHEFWWELNGPRRFLESIEDDLYRDPKNIAVKIPFGLGDFFQQMLNKLRLKNREDQWKTVFFDEKDFLDAIGAGNTPEETERALLHDIIHCRNERLSDKGRAKKLAILRKFVESMAIALQQSRPMWEEKADDSPILLFNKWFRNNDAGKEPLPIRFIEIRDVTYRTWDYWKVFFGEYHKLCHGDHEKQLPRFLVPLDRVRRSGRYPSETSFKIHLWEKSVRRFDMQYYVAQLLGINTSGKELDLELHLRWEVVTELAGTSPCLADKLGDVGLETLLDTEKLAGVITQKFGLTTFPHENETEALLFVDGKVKTSGFLRGSKCHFEIQRRIWRAESHVLMPLLELYRKREMLRYTKELNAQLPVQQSKAKQNCRQAEKNGQNPNDYDKQWRDIRTIEDLDLGNIYTLLHSYFSRQHNTFHLKTMELRKNMRNDLAHFKTIGSTMLQHMIDLYKELSG